MFLPSTRLWDSEAPIYRTKISAALTCKAYLGGASFRNADLSSTAFSDQVGELDQDHLDLRDACLYDANFYGVVAPGVDLRGADLSGVNIPRGFTKHALLDSRTRLPKNYAPPAALR
jgi:uncharacterized protein YjbI with pentapeptide repeats